MGLIGELCESVGPLVFAGYGGRIARLRHETMMADAGFAGVLAAEERVDEIRRAWAEEAPVPAIFAVLLGLAAAPPASYGEDEQYEVLQLLTLCVRRDPGGFAAERERWGASAGLVEVDEWLADDDAG
jgi:hypothetical protein